MAMSRCFGGTRLTTRPPIAISPSLISSSPAIIRSSVLLPQPDGPTSTVNSPSAISMLTPCSTCVEPNALRTSRMETVAMGVPGVPPSPGSAPRSYGEHTERDDHWLPHAQQAANKHLLG